MTEGIRAPNLPLGTNLGEFLGLEVVGPTRSVKRFTRASVLGGIDAAISGFQAGGGIIFSSKIQANGALNYDAYKMAWIISDPLSANNGIYQKVGASGSGSWTKIAELPYSIVYAQNDGSGTVNAVVATSGVPVSASPYSQLISIPFLADNTGPMTLAINGETPRALLTNTGSAITTGYVHAGMSALVQIDRDGAYRLFSYGDASAIQTAIEIEANRIDGLIASIVPQKSLFTGDGVTTTFNLGSHATEATLDVYIEGVWQNSDTWSITGAGAGTNLVFSSAPPAAALPNIEVKFGAQSSIASSVPDPKAVGRTELATDVNSGVSFKTMADAVASADPAMPYINLGGWTVAGDPGKGMLVAVGAEPTTGPSFQIGTQWYKWSSDYVTPESCRYSTSRTTDQNHASLQALLDHCAAVGLPGIIPPNQYYAKAGLPLQWDNYTTLIGSGERSIIRQTGAATALQSKTYTSARKFGLKLYNLSIQGNTSPVSGSMAIDMRNASRCVLRDCYLYGFDVQVQLYADFNTNPALGCYYNLFDNVELGTQRRGYEIGLGANANWIRGGRVVSSTDTAISLSDGSQNWVDQTEIATFTNYGVRVSGPAYDTLIHHPRIEDGLTGVGVSIDASAVRTSLWHPQYTSLGGNYANLSPTTMVNGRYRKDVTEDRGPIASQSTDDGSIIALPGFSRDTSGATLTASYALDTGLMAMIIPAASGVYIRLMNGTAGIIDPLSRTHNISFWNQDGM